MSETADAGNDKPTRELLFALDVKTDNPAALSTLFGELDEHGYKIVNDEDQVKVFSELRQPTKTGNIRTQIFDAISVLEVGEERPARDRVVEVVATMHDHDEPTVEAAIDDLLQMGELYPPEKGRLARPVVDGGHDE